MPQSHADVWIHLVFSTKHRRPVLADEDLREQMFRMLAHHVVESAGCLSGSVGGHVDHVHLLIGLSRTITIAKLVEIIKVNTSAWAKESVPDFQWQNGYGAFSVSRSLNGNVDRYIRTQEEHHKRMSYQDEFRLLCKKHGIEIDERYVWD